MRYYIAADSRLQAQARQLRDALNGHGLECTSRWLDVKLERFHPVTEDVLTSAAENNFSDIDRAIFLVALNPKVYHDSGTGGRHVELGYALAKYKTVIYVGEKLENVFHRAIGVRLTVSPDLSTPEMARVIATYVKSIWDRAKSQR